MGASVQYHGMNAITVFVLSGLVAKTMGLIKVTQDDGTLISLQRHIYTHLFVPIASPLNASLLYAICFIGVMFPGGLVYVANEMVS